MSQALEQWTEDSAGVRPRLWSREEYVRMAELGILDPEERLELIEGEILRMSPQKNRHAAAITLAHRACLKCFPTGCWVRVAAALALGDYSMPEPDIAVVQGEIAEHPEDYPNSAVLIIEASDTTLTLDRTRKSSLYAKAAIPDYWIQNLVDGILEVRRDPMPITSAIYGWDYASVTFYTKNQQPAPLAAPDVLIAVNELLP